MILVLLAAAALSLWASGGEDWLDAAIILGIVAVNAVISLTQEDSARKALEALSQMSAPAGPGNAGRGPGPGGGGEAGARRCDPSGGGGPGARRLPDFGGGGAPGRRVGHDRRVRPGEQGGCWAALPADTPLAERRNLLLSATVITRGRATCRGGRHGDGHRGGPYRRDADGETERDRPLQKKMGRSPRPCPLCACACAR